MKAGDRANGHLGMVKTRSRDEEPGATSCDERDFSGKRYVWMELFLQENLS
jgi:hypothetical protein